MNLKKCSTLKVVPLLLLSALTLSSSIAAVPSTIESDLKAFRSEKKIEFRDLTAKWKRDYGDRSLPELLKIAKNPKAADPDRFIAILSIAHLHPAEAQSKIRPFFKYSSWMLKSAALQSAVLLSDKSFLPEIIACLKDPALVIRAEAAESLGKLGWTESRSALVDSLYDGQNYRPADFKKGIADWVPQKALAALREMAKNDNREENFNLAGGSVSDSVSGTAARAANASLTKELLPLMNHAADAKLRAHALFTIEKIEKKELLPTGTFHEKRVAWNRLLVPEKADTIVYASQSSARRRTSSVTSSARVSSGAPNRAAQMKAVPAKGAPAKFAPKTEAKALPKTSKP